MPSCPQCGEENPDRAKFCLACGAGLELAGSREQRKTVTVLFSDLVGSTELGERLDPESIRRVISRYFEEMHAVLARHGATVEKFIGDAIMAVFGIPSVHEDDALRALRAAAEMRERLGVLNEELEREWGVRLKARTGVNTGEVVAGDPSRGQAFVSGDAVNVAARLEQAAAPDEILLGERTNSLGAGAIHAEPAGPLTMKGKSEALSAWRLIDVSSGAAALRAHDDSPFVGRSDEVRELERVLERAITERACILATIVGPPGIGKSRLVREFTLSAAKRARVVSGRCLPYGDGITYWPLAEIVGDIAGDDLPGTVTRAIGEDAGVVADRIAAAVGSAESPGSKAEIFWAFRKLFEALAKQRPLIAVIDDIHWAQPTLLDLLEYMVGFASDSPILLVCLARPELFEARPSWAVPRQNAFLVPLQPISKGEAAALIERLTSEQLPAGARARVAQAAEGNPLFIEQLLALNADAHPENGEMLVPPTIQALLAARIDRLTPAERVVVECAAIEGRSFHRGAVVELLEEQARPTVGACLISLARKEFIQPHQALFAGDDAFRFGHMLIRDAAYEAVPKQLRARLHERFAHWLERAAGDKAVDYEEILAYHLEQAYRYQRELGRGDEAGLLAEHAGRRLATTGLRALARGDMPAAINLLSRAADVLPRDDPGRLELLSELATAMVEAGELAKADAVIREASERAEAGGHELARWRATIAGLALQSWTKAASNEELVAGAETAAAACEQLGDELGLARSWHLIGLFRGWCGESIEAEEAFQHAAEHAGRAGERRQESAALTWLLITAWFGQTPASQGVQRCGDALNRTDDRGVEATALTELGCFLAMQGHFDDARSHFARGHAMLEDLGQQLAAAGSSQEFFDIEMLAGDPAAAEHRLRAACETLEQMGEKGFLATRVGCLAEAIYAQRRFTEADEMSRQAEDLAAADVTDLDAQYRWRATRAKLLARRGEFEAAERLVREAAALIEGTDWVNSRADVQRDLAEVLQSAGRGAEAVQHLEEALRLFEAKENQVAAAKTRELLAALNRSVLGNHGRQ
jgi:class 3 adenylate cyclase/tetratricopeptide (TPR) repeat protein